MDTLVSNTHRLCVVGFALIAAIVLPSCTFDGSALESRKCKTTNVCIRAYGEGFQCLEGYCVKESPCEADEECAERLGQGFVCVQAVCRESIEPACFVDTDCDDGLFCNGAERCAAEMADSDARGCVSGDPVDTDDGIACTNDICVEDGASIQHIPTEECDCTDDGDCQQLAMAEGRICTVGTCTAEFACSFAQAPPETDCDDGIACTLTAACNNLGECIGTPNNAACDDGLFCNGTEACSPTDPSADLRGCTEGEAPEASDDGVACTESFCNEELRTVAQEPTEACGCLERFGLCNDPEPDDCFVLRCSGEFVCVPEPIQVGSTCDDGFACTARDRCTGENRCEGEPDNSVCDNGMFCDGREFCEPSAETADGDGCLLGAPPLESDGLDCTEDVCNEESDQFEFIDRGCVCETDMDCLPEIPNPCLAYACTGGGCAITPQPATERCDDGVACTRDDMCDGEGSCLGEAEDVLCNDELFCNGIEVCQASHPNVDANGCRLGNAPVVSDSIDCTIDSCEECTDPDCVLGLDGAVVHNAAACGCATDADCEEEFAQQPCVTGRCNLQSFSCVPVVLEPGASCDDGVACTQETVCQENQTCAGGRNDPSVCADSLFCNGEEACDPSADGANPATGCLPGISPTEEEEGLSPCEVAVCNEEADSVEIDVSRCDCSEDADCLPDDPNPCLNYVCEMDSRSCVDQPKGEDALCNDGFACTARDSCDGAGNCQGEPENSACTDGLFCNGEELCLPDAEESDEDGCAEGTDPTFGQELEACETVSCDEEQDRVVVDSSRCDCTTNDECTTPCTDVAQCVDGVCLRTFRNGEACQVTCDDAPGGVNGICTNDVCATEPEGPIQIDDLCSDGRDNDCDSNTDLQDSDCLQPDHIAIVDSTMTASAGLLGPGADITIQAQNGEQAVTGQHDSIYCVGRMIAQRWEMSALVEDNLPTPLTIDGSANYNVLHDEGDAASARGVSLCDGGVLTIGPLDMPANTSAPFYTFAMEVVAANHPIAQNHLAAEQYLMVSYNADETNNDYQTLLALGNGELGDSVVRPHVFHIPNSVENNTLTLRLEIVKTSGDYSGSCAFLEAVNLFNVRNVEVAGNLQLNDALYYNWTYDDVTTSSTQVFGAGANNALFAEFFTLDPAVGFTGTVENSGGTDGKGAKFRFHALGDASVAVASSAELPRFGTIQPTIDRALPMLFDLNFSSDKTEWSENELGHIELALSTDTYKLASGPSKNEEPDPYKDFYSVETRHSISLPESAKTLRETRLRISPDAYGSTDERMRADYMHVYSHTAHGLDIAIESSVADMSNPGEYVIGVRSDREGQVQVQCYWQPPMDVRFPTLATEPVVLEFTP